MTPAYASYSGKFWKILSFFFRGRGLFRPVSAAFSTLADLLAGQSAVVLIVYDGL